MQELYRDTPYCMKVNGQISDPFYTDMGVLQGCALSPSLYNKYLRDCLLQVEQRCQHMGIQLHDADMRCVQSDFADDIHGTVAVQHVGAFVQVVREVLAEKDQSLNLAKCKVLVISKDPWPHPTIDGIPVVHEHKILGIMYTHNGCANTAVQERVRRGTAKAALHWSRLHHFGCHHDMEITSSMIKQDVQPTLLFGAAFWGHYNMSSVDPMRHPLQAPYSVLQRMVLAQPHWTAHWTVSLMTGMLPIQHWVVRDFCRLWNRLLAVCADNSLVDQCIRLQVHMLQRNQRCWLQRWSAVFRRLLPDEDVHTCLAAGEPVDEHSVLRGLCGWYRQVITRMGNPWDLNEVEHRKIAFAWHMVSHSHSWGEVPQVVSVQLPVALRTVWLRFLAANSVVPARHYSVIRACPEFRHRLCTKCTLHRVADEHHILLVCPTTAATRARFGSVLRMHDSLQGLIYNNRSAWHVLARFVLEAWRAYDWIPVG